MPGPAPPVVDGLQIDQALGFQRRFQNFQRIAWWVLAVVPVAAVAGLFGGGLWSQTRAGGDASGVRVTYDRFARVSVDTQLELELTGARGAAEVAVSRELLDHYDIQEIRPEPQRVTTLHDRLVLSFLAAPGGEVLLVLQPDAIGRAVGTVTVGRRPPVHLSQLVWP